MTQYEASKGRINVLEETCAAILEEMKGQVALRENFTKSGELTSQLSCQRCYCSKEALCSCGELDNIGKEMDERDFEFEVLCAA